MTKVNKAKGNRMTKVERNNRRVVGWRKEAKSMVHFKHEEGRKRKKEMERMELVKPD